MKKLGDKYPESNLKVFDIASKLSEIYNNPEKYGFDKNKITTPFTKSKDFKHNPNGTTPSDGYMFWDDVHFTADGQAIIADLLEDEYRPEFDFSAPDAEKTRPEEVFPTEHHIMACA